MSKPMETSARPDKQRCATAKTKYEIYKQATASISSWLSITARQVGITSTQDNCHLKSHQYKAIVEVLVSTKPAIKVPIRILKLARMAYLARSKVNEFVRGHDLESDKRHEHFISIIKEVYDMLYAHFQEQGTDEEKTKAAEMAVQGQRQQEQRGSFFDLLELEDLEKLDEDGLIKSGVGEVLPEDLLAAQDSKKKKSSKKVRDRLKAKREVLRIALEQHSKEAEEGEEDDPYFVLLCLLADLKAMRAYIKELWTEYKAGKVDLMTVSVTTNATFDIIRKYKADVPAIQSLLDNYPSTLDAFFARYLPGAHEKELDLFSTFQPYLHRQEVVVKYLTINEELTDMTFANSLYFLTGRQYYGHMRDNARLLRESNRAYAEHGFISITDDFFFKRDECKGDKRPWATKSFVERLRDDRGNLASLNCDLNVCILMRKMAIPDTLGLDDITAEWLSSKGGSMGSSKQNVTLAQSFGGQLYLDIVNVLEGDAKRGYAEMNEKCSEVLKSITLCRQESPNHNLVNRLLKKQLRNSDERIRWGEQTDVNLLSQAEIYAYLFHDAAGCFNSKRMLGEFNVSEEEKSRGLEDPDLEDLSLFEKHPLLSGIIMFQLTQWFRKEAIFTASSWGHVVVAAQLYYACKLHRDLRTGAKKMSTRKSVYKGSEYVQETKWTEKPLEWTEMDYLFDLFGAERFFYYTLPTSNFELIMYNEATEVSVSSKGYTEKIEECNNACNEDIFLTPKVSGRSKVDLDGEMLRDRQQEAISTRLFLAKYFHTGTETKAISEWTEEDLHVLLEGRSNLVEDKRSGQVKRHHDSQVGLLNALKSGLQEEHKASDFNFLSFHVYCLNMLRYISEEFPKLCPSLPYHGQPVSKQHGFADQSHHADLECLATTIFQLMYLPEMSYKGMKDFKAALKGRTEDISTPVITDPVVVILDKIINAYLAANPYPLNLDCYLNAYKHGKPDPKWKQTFSTRYDNPNVLYNVEELCKSYAEKLSW